VTRVVECRLVRVGLWWWSIGWVLARCVGCGWRCSGSVKRWVVVRLVVVAGAVGVRGRAPRRRHGLR
jgi:hypothetical protein